MSNKLEDFIPVVKYHGLNSEKSVDLTSSTVTNTVAFNYIGTESGTSDNAFVATLEQADGTDHALTAGMMILLKIGRRLVTGTATTLVLNGTSKSVTSHSSGAVGNNVKTTFQTGAILPMLYDGTRWQVVGF